MNKNDSEQLGLGDETFDVKYDYLGWRDSRSEWL